MSQPNMALLISYMHRPETVMTMSAFAAPSHTGSFPRPLTRGLDDFELPSTLQASLNLTHRLPVGSRLTRGPTPSAFAAPLAVGGTTLRPPCGGTCGRINAKKEKLEKGINNRNNKNRSMIFKEARSCGRSSVRLFYKGHT